MAEPYNVYGGLQDNGVWKGPSTYEYSYSWYEEGKYPYERLMGGDGMQVAIDTRTNELVYTGYQFGNYFRINMKTGDRQYITPSHQLDEEPLRWNWESPIMLSSHNQDIVYFGSNKFHRSMNQGDDFETLSGDLTKGGIKGDVSYGTLTSISESPLRFGLIYTGSDDGLVHVSKDAGQTWTNISTGLPADFWVGNVQASSHVEGRVFVSFNGYRWDNFEPMVYVSNDYGKSWTSISANLPKEPVNVIKEDPKDANILYVGTDHGAYVSLNMGKSYMAFSKDLPAVAIHDLAIHPRENDLILGSHGRSIFIADVTALQQLPATEAAVKVFRAEGATFSDRWGDKGYYWGDPYEPSTTLEIFTRSSGTATLTITKDDLTLKEWTADVDAGLNYIDYDFTIAASAAPELQQALELEEDLEAKENGSYYLQSGDYTLRVMVGGASASETLSIKEPRERPKRKGSK